jgi:hypothetical protein
VPQCHSCGSRNRPGKMRIIYNPRSQHKQTHQNLWQGKNKRYHPQFHSSTSAPAKESPRKGSGRYAVRHDETSAKGCLSEVGNKRKELESKPTLTRLSQLGHIQTPNSLGCSNHIPKVCTTFRSLFLQISVAEAGRAASIPSDQAAIANLSRVGYTA